MHGAAIDAVIEGYFLSNIQRSVGINSHYKHLWEQMYRLIQSGGKRLRPHMVLLAYETFGGTRTIQVVPLAVSFEILHLGMLIHDDIIDRDFIRYGVDNIAGSFQKEYAAVVSDPDDRLHYAQSAAILAGDLLISGSYEIMAQADVDATKIMQVQRLFSDSIFEVAGGELLDTESSFRGLGAIPAETIARYKTASYSFIGPLLAGALLADASIEDQANIKRFAENLGVAYQLIDDSLGIFGESQHTGKTTNGDIREGKNTYLVEQFYQLAAEAQKQQFEQYFGDKDITEVETEIVKNLLRASGALAANNAAVSAYIERAKSAITALSIRDSLKKNLEILIEVVIRRSK